MTLCKEVSDTEFEQVVLENPRPVLVEFWAPWCGPCQVVGPVLEKLAEEYANEIDIVKMNVDQNQDIPARLQVRGIPNMMMFRKGELLDTLVGMPDPNKIVEMMESALEDK